MGISKKNATPILRTEKSSTLKTDVARSSKRQQIYTKWLGVTFQKTVLLKLL
jgi:hypothetical protein